MGPLDQFAQSDLSASKTIVRRYLERGFVKPALARLQLCVSGGPIDDEVLELLVEAFDRLGKTEKAEFVRGMLARRRRESHAWDDESPTSLYIDMSDFDGSAAWDDVPTDRWKVRGHGFFTEITPSG
jgi:hypothetical protein